MLIVAQGNRLMVSLKLPRHFCGVCVSLSLALPLATFYTRSIFFDMSLAEKDLAMREERGPSTKGCFVVRVALIPGERRSALPRSGAESRWGLVVEAPVMAIQRSVVRVIKVRL